MSWNAGNVVLLRLCFVGMLISSDCFEIYLVRATIYGRGKCFALFVFMGVVCFNSGICNLWKLTSARECVSHLRLGRRGAPLWEARTLLRPNVSYEVRSRKRTALAA